VFVSPTETQALASVDCARAGDKTANSIAAPSSLPDMVDNASLRRNKVVRRLINSPIGQFGETHEAGDAVLRRGGST
jgi:hypothetical protein